MPFTCDVREAIGSAWADARAEVAAAKRISTAKPVNVLNANFIKPPEKIRVGD